MYCNCLEKNFFFTRTFLRRMVKVRYSRYNFKRITFVVGLYGIGNYLNPPTDCLQYNIINLLPFLEQLWYYYEMAFIDMNLTVYLNDLSSKLHDLCSLHFYAGLRISLAVDGIVMLQCIHKLYLLDKIKRHKNML